MQAVGAQTVTWGGAPGEKHVQAVSQMFGWNSLCIFKYGGASRQREEKLKADTK